MEYTVDTDSLLIDELKLIFPELSTNKIRKMLSNNRIRVDGIVVNKAKTKVNSKKYLIIFILFFLSLFQNHSHFQFLSQFLEN